MAKRGRKTLGANVVALDVTTTRPRLTPPSLLTKAEAKIFSDTARLNPHLSEPDIGLLAAYAQALVKTYRLARRDDSASVKSWDQTSRVVLAMSRALRLAPINQVHPETAGRRRRDLNNGTPPWSAADDYSDYKKSELGEDDE